MRQHCLQCFRKHLGNAAVLIEEVYDGYPYKYMVIGHLDQAAQEIRELSPKLATLVRAHRIKLQMDWRYSIPFEAINMYIDTIEALGGDEAKFDDIPEIPEECYNGLDRNADDTDWDLFEGDQR